MKKFIIQILLIFPLFGYGQSSIDSLKNLLNHEKNPQHRIDLLNLIAYETIDYNIEEAFSIARQAFDESRKIKYEGGQGWALITQGIYSLLSGNPNQAIINNKQALKIGIKIEENKIRDEAMLQIGKALREIGLYDSALNYYNELESFYTKKQNPTILYRTFIIVSEIYLEKGYPDNALIYAEKALLEASQMQSSFGTTKSWMTIGNAYRNKFDFEKAKKYYDKISGLEHLFNWQLIELEENMGVFYLMQGDLNLAMSYFTRVLKQYEKFQGAHALARIMNKIGHILQEKGLYDVAQEYLFKSTTICNESGYIFLSGEAYLTLAKVNYEARQFEEAFLNVREAQQNFIFIHDELNASSCNNLLGQIQMRQGNFDSSFFYHKKALIIQEKISNPKLIASTLSSIGELYAHFNRTTESLNYFIRGIEIDSNIQNQYGVAKGKDRLGGVYIELEKYDLAIENLSQSINLSKRFSFLNILSDSYHKYSILEEKRGNYKSAILYRKLFEENYQIIYNTNTAQSLASYITLYNVANKDRQIELLNKDKRIQEDEIQIRNLIIYGSMTISIMLGFLVFAFVYSFKKQKKLNGQLHEKNEEILVQSENLKLANHNLVILNNEVKERQLEIEAQSKKIKISNQKIASINERLEKTVLQRTADLKRAYLELDTFFYRSSHDFRRPLTTLMGLYQVAKLSVEDQNAVNLFEMVNSTAVNLDKMLVKLQTISDVGAHQLTRKDVLIRQLVESVFDAKKSEIQLKQIQFIINIKKDDVFISYPSLIKIIVENLIENAIDFYTPDNPRIEINLIKTNESVSIEVKDNGEGISDEIRPQIFEMFFRGTVRSTGNGLGLYIAQKAAKKARGKILFRNNPEGGTTFTLEIRSHSK